MKILLLGDPASIHTVKWVNSLSEKGLTIHLFGLGKENSRISDKVVQHMGSITHARGNIIQKLKYLTAIPHLKKVYREVKPDIVHAHFATSYGLLGKFLNPPLYVISIWGSDVFDFPKKSYIHRAVLKHILTAADLLLSTSDSMKSEGQRYTGKEIFVTPFGVDLKAFKPDGRHEKRSVHKDVFELGVVKALEKKYGIDVLIRAYAEVVQKTSINTRLTIVGGGSQMEALKKLVVDLQLTSKVAFTGPVPHASVVRYHQLFDVEIFPSILDSESFGVSVVEAMACGTPVIVSDVSGFKEVVSDGECGLVVKRNHIDDLANGILKMIMDESKRKNYIQKALQKVNSHYDWNENVDMMLSHYKKLLANHS